MALKRYSYLTKLSYSTDGTNFTALVDTKKIKGLKAKRAKVDTTWLESPNAYTETGANLGWKSTDPAKFQVYLTDAQYTTLLGFFETGDEYTWKITLPKVSGQTNAPTVTWKGFVSDVDPSEQEAGSDAPIMVDFEIERTTDKFTFTAGS